MIVCFHPNLMSLSCQIASDTSLQPACPLSEPDILGPLDPASDVSLQGDCCPGSAHVVDSTSRQEPACPSLNDQSRRLDLMVSIMQKHSDS